MNAPKLEIHYADEWAALYLDGQLTLLGDAYAAEQRALDLAGVTLVFDDAFMRGQDRATGVAPTLADIATYRTKRDADEAEANRLRRKAERLAERAAQLEGRVIPRF